MSMGLKGVPISPGKGGRWPKDQRKRAIRVRRLKSAGAYKRALENERGFNLSRGAASECKSLDPRSPEYLDICRRYMK